MASVYKVSFYLRTAAVASVLFALIVGVAGGEKSCHLEEDSNVISLLQVSSTRNNGTQQGLNLRRHSKRDLREFPFYHSSKDIAHQMRHLKKSCGGALHVKTVSEQNTSIDVATVRKPGSSPVNRVFILFGEHSRELISPESGLHFLKTLCSALESASGAPDTYTLKDASDVDVLSVLQDSEFQMVLNGNPVSREKVESGSFCLRTNQNGVDLNRNWDEMWEGDGFSGSDTNPGPHPFSEPETRIFKELVSVYKPTTFLTVHSGTRGMYMPWAYDMEHMANRNAPEMMEVLKVLDQEHCQCPYGAAGKEVGYPCPGTCLDWVYDKLSTPYVFAFEIYTDEERGSGLTERWREKLKSGGSFLLQSGSHLGHKHFANLFKEYASDFVHADSEAEGNAVDSESQADSKMAMDYCFSMFNPDSLSEYTRTIENWSTVYLKMSKLLAEKIRNTSGNETQSDAGKE